MTGIRAINGRVPVSLPQSAAADGRPCALVTDFLILDDAAEAV
jgi:hypothetical protein